MLIQISEGLVKSIIIQVAHTCNPSTQEAEAGGLPGVQGQLHEFQKAKYRIRPCLKKKRFHSSWQTKQGTHKKMQGLFLSQVSKTEHEKAVDSHLHTF